MNDADQVVVTAKTIDAGEDPRIKIFHVEVLSPEGCWTETVGSREQLQWLLKGLTIGLRISGYAALLSWNLPELWHEPSAIRFTIPRHGLMEMEELDSSGNVIRI